MMKAARLINTFARVTALLLMIAAMHLPVSAAPVIACPPGTIDADAIVFGEVKIALVVEGADSVYIADGSWKNNEFTFVATRPGPRDFIIYAWSGPDTVSCMVKVNVVLNGSPILSASDDTPPAQTLSAETHEWLAPATAPGESSVENLELYRQDL